VSSPGLVLTIAEHEVRWQRRRKVIYAVRPRLASTKCEVLRNGAMSGSIFETFVVSEILKSYSNSGKATDGIYYYRDKDKKEIDLIIEDGNTIYPIEIKKSGNVSKDWVKNFNVLAKISGKQIGKGAVICLAEHRIPINDMVDALPIEYV